MVRSEDGGEIKKGGTRDKRVDGEKGEGGGEKAMVAEEAMRKNILPGEIVKKRNKKINER